MMESARIYVDTQATFRLQAEVLVIVGNPVFPTILLRSMECG